MNDPNTNNHIRATNLAVTKQKVTDATGRMLWRLGWARERVQLDCRSVVRWFAPTRIETGDTEPAPV